MKIIFRLISAALFLIAAAACNLSEINNPDDPNNNGSGKKEYSITAKIIQTRVLYTDGAVLKQEWEIGDRLIGCYSSSGVKTIEFSVELINADGSANLKLESGTLPENDTRIALIYDPYRNSDISSGSLSVDICSQNFDIDNQGTSVLPAFMSASAVYTEAEGAEFVFQNDCAIIEVDGIYKTGKTSGSEINSVSSINIENVIATGSYTFDPSEGKFSLSGNSEGAITVSCSRTLDWQTGVLDKPVFLAVIPNETSNSIGVTFFSSTEQASCTVADYGTTAFAPGKCYVIYPKDMVAKTVDNQYFTSVAAAFEHAAAISSEHQTDNTVTLVKKEIYGLLEDDPHDTEIDPLKRIGINYPVTLDLNGCTLDLDYWEEDSYDRGGFKVTENGSLIVKDEIGSGCIQSVSYCPVIENEGEVIILGGELKNWESSGDFPPVIENHGTLKVMCGKLFSHAGSAIDSNGSLIIGNKENYSTSEYEIDISCESGAADGTFVPAINCSGGSIDIYDGIVHSLSSSAVNLTGDADGKIYGGYLVNGGLDTIQLLDGADCTISGGVIKCESFNSSAIWCQSTSTANHPSTLTVTWPEEISNPSSGTIKEPIIYSTGDNGAAVPISAYDTRSDNTAEIIINGGFLISNNPSGLFYIDDNDTSKYKVDNLNLVDGKGKVIFGNFYSNVSKLNMDGHNSTSIIDLGADGGKVIDTISDQYFYADYQGDGSGFKIPNTTDTTGDLYKIDPVEENDGYPGTDLEPVEIGGVVWAPVNCGYDENHPYGLLYQWGRKYGQGYDGEEGEPEPVDLDNEQLLAYPDQDDTNAGKFYTNSGALYNFSNIYKLWDSNDSVVANPTNVSQQNPAKTTNDPCPKGWRVPTCYDFSLLGDEDLNNLSLPPAGMRDEYGEVDGRGDEGYYWTSSVDGDVAPSPWFFAFPSFGDSIMQGSTLYGCSIRCVKE